MRNGNGLTVSLSLKAFYFYYIYFKFPFIMSSLKWLNIKQKIKIFFQDFIFGIYGVMINIICT